MSLATQITVNPFLSKQRRQPIGDKDDRWQAALTDLNAAIDRLWSRHPQANRFSGAALVGQLFVKLSHGKGLSFHDRSHYFALSACILRQICVQVAQQYKAKGLGNASTAFTLATLDQHCDPLAVDVIGLDHALSEIGKEDEQLVKLVELRFFAGLKIPACATVLNMSDSAVDRAWFRARMRLYHNLRQ